MLSSLWFHTMFPNSWDTLVRVPAQDMVPIYVRGTLG